MANVTLEIDNFDQIKNSLDQQKHNSNENHSGMTESSSDAQMQQPKLNVDVVEAETKPSCSSIPTTPDDPSPSTAPSWPIAAPTSITTVTTTTTTTETVVTVRQSPDSSIEIIDNTDEGTMHPGASTSSESSDIPTSAIFGEHSATNDGTPQSEETFQVNATSDSGIENCEIINVGNSDITNATRTSPILIDDLRLASVSSSRSGSTVSEDDDLLQASANTVIAAPVSGLSSFCTSGGATVIIAGHSDAVTLHPSISAGNLPTTNSNSTMGHHYRHHQPYSAVLLSQLSDTDSVGSNDSIQDLITTTNDATFHRQTSSGASTVGYYRGPPVMATGCITSASRHYSAHQLLHQQVASTSAAAMAAVRAMSQNTLATIDDDLGGVPRSSIVAYEFPHVQPHYSAKHLHTEQVVSKHTLKGKLNKFQRLLDKAFTLVHMGTEESIIEGCGIVAKVMVNAWVAPKIGHDLAYGLCDYLREMTYFDQMLHFLLNPETKQRVRLAAGRALEECLSAPNRDYIASTSTSADNSVASHRLERFVQVIKSFKDGEELRVAVSLLESLFKQSQQTNSRLIELSALDYVLNACKATTNQHTLRHAALAICNLSMYSDNECQQRMIAKNVPDWLFLLASSQDDVTRYYACLAICVLVSNKEIETAVLKSGTLSLVEPFLLAHKPADFATSDYKHCQGRPQQWLAKLVPVLNAKRRESRAMAAFHFAMEAGIKKDQEALDVFEQIGAVEALKQVAALPEEVAPKFSSLALEIIGEEVPYKLSHQVPLWSVEDVQYWVTHIGFEKYANAFFDQKVDGDLLLLISESELADDIEMKSGLLRKRFMRELESLKMAADYSCVDETQLDRFLVSVNPQFSVYTYRLLEMGVDRSILPSITNDMMKSDCGISNPVHRSQLLQSVQEYKHIDDMEVALLSKHIDIFISYRRSTGNQLASLIKVLLQLRGYKVFIDVDRLYAGKFDSSLLKNIQAAKHFVLVLTPNALDRCVDDDECTDWVHKEVLCALEHNKNIIPIFDPQFEWPDDQLLPGDIRGVTRFNGVRWVHEYQEACVDKLEKFIEGEINIDRGYNASPQRGQQQQHGVNYRSTSKTNSVNSSSGNHQLATVPDAADLVFEALSTASRGRTLSHDQLLSQ